jgi:hypothetical protein
MEASTACTLAQLPDRVRRKESLGGAVHTFQER